ncbi:efflux RND transporter permease subunit [Hydrogenimonas urashimensis]|uniref:efflux RND transporter permease subunit n=1 Tax=Hydrogenimonas urashimensis TaxID=2740515 RepID=UPI001915F359|nr:efflux RND transporter permease subunit [Hydrogenimonas urashimensis]
MFSLFFIRRPVVAKVISILIVLVGLIALKNLPIAQFPQIVPPTIQVQARYPGGSADAVEKLVTTPIEERLNGAEGLVYTTSTSASDGTATIKAYFKLGTDLDTAAVDVQNRVALAMPTLPEEVKRQGVVTKKLSSSVLEILAVRSDDPLHDALFLSNFAALNIVEELKRIDGVSDVVIFGEHRYAMRIWLDPDRMAALGVSVDEVINSIRSQNLEVSLGSIGDMAASDKSRYRYTLVAKTRLETPKMFGRIIIRQNTNGTKIRLRDIARIELGSETYSSSAYLNNRPSAQLGIFLLPDANALNAAEKIAETIKHLSVRFPKGVHVEPTYDTTKFVKASIEEVVQTLFEALVLVLLVVFLFLQSLRATIIPAVAIPVSLVGTFAAMYLTGFSINTLTLFGLILAIGIVVDDAILVVENVEANLQKDPSLSIKDATARAMKEIFAPVISTTLVLLAVFVPVALIPGISGALYRQFAMTIAFSVLISAIVALTLSPALAATILKRSTGEKNRFFLLFDRALEGLKKGYRTLLGFLIQRKGWVLGFYVLLLAATWWIFKSVPTGFLPEEDQGAIIAAVSMQPGTTLQRLEKTTARLVEKIEKVPGVKEVSSINGYSTVTGVGDSSVGTFYIILDDWQNRTTSETSIGALIKKIEKIAKATVPEAQVKLFSPPSIPGLSAVGGFEVNLENSGAVPLDHFEKEVRAYIEALNADARIASAYTMFNADYPQIEVDVDRDKTYALGIALNDLFAVLQTYLSAYYVNDFNKFGKTYRVLLQADPAYRNIQNDISAFFVRNRYGRMIPLSTVVALNRSIGPNAVTHFNGYQSIAVNGVHNVPKGYSSGDALAAIEETAQKVLPKNVALGYGGMTLQEKEAGNAAAPIFALSLFIVFLVLSAQYESWLTPLMIMLPIPAVMFGALGTNVMAGLINDIYTQIGLVLLIGMASKNAILIVEFAKEMHEGGMEIVEAAIEASILRMRAILMTAFAFLLGILPLVFASGAGAASRRSLGTAVFGGMAMSTLLTFLLTPVLFVVLQSLKTRFLKERG